MEGVIKPRDLLRAEDGYSRGIVGYAGVYLHLKCLRAFLSSTISSIVSS